MLLLGHDPTCKPPPWSWQWEQTHAYRMGLPRPVAVVPCWEGAGSRVMSVLDANPGALGAAAAWGNGGLQFTGLANSSVAWAAEGNFALPVTAKQLTVSALVANANPAQTNAYVVYQPTNCWAFLYGFSANTYAFFGGSGGGIGEITLQSGVQDTRPHLLTAAFNGVAGTLQLFYDGALTYSAPNSGVFNTFANGFRLAGAAATSALFAGSVLGVVIHSQALTQSQVQRLAAAPYAFVARAGWLLAPNRIELRGAESGSGVAAPGLRTIIQQIDSGHGADSASTGPPASYSVAYLSALPNPVAYLESLE